MDLSLFKYNKQECNGLDQCSFLLRIATCMRYYQLLSKNGTNSESDRAKMFILFLTESYSLMLLEDYIHLICTHSRDLAQMTLIFENEYKVSGCKAIHRCGSVEQHLQHRRNDEALQNANEEDEDAYNFYVHLFHTIHCYIYHSESLGFRCFTSSDHEHAQKHEKQTNGCYDASFACISEHIESNHSKHSNDRWRRRIAKRKEKYRIRLYVTNEMENTFRSQMLINLHRKHQISSANMQKLTQFLEAEHYDTDCIIHDVEDREQCNLLQATNGDEHCIEYIAKMSERHRQNVKKCANNTNVNGSPANALSVGIVFWYWPYYKNEHPAAKTLDGGGAGDADNDFYRVTDLYVSARYASLKKEVLHSRLLSIGEFNEFVVEKGNKYVRTTACKALRCVMKDDPYNYEIYQGEAIRFEHVHALILYCDFMDFYHAFSKTFKKRKWDESLEAMKNRHSRYCHSAQSLRELVEYFGSKPSRDVAQHHHLYYLGVCNVVNIASFAIHLNAPTSVTRFREVVVNYMHDDDVDGMLLELSTFRAPSNRVAVLDASWMSAFPQEHEHIFCGGRHGIQIQSVLMLRTKSNYRAYLDAFYKLDVLLSADYEQLNTSDIDIIHRFVQSAIDADGEDDGDAVDAYIVDTFRLFRAHKVRIKLNTFRIDQYIVHREQGILDLLMHPLRQYAYDSYLVEDDTNIFKMCLLRIFPNIQHIILWSTSYVGDLVYPFSLCSFVAALQTERMPHSLRSIVVKARPYRVDHRQFKMPGDSHQMMQAHRTWLKHHVYAADFESNLDPDQNLTRKFKVTFESIPFEQDTLTFSFV